MTNLQYEIRIPQKIYNRATITEKVYYENYWNRLYVMQYVPRVTAPEHQRYNSNRIRKTQNEHPNIICQNLNSQYFVNLMPIS